MGSPGPRVGRPPSQNWFSAYVDHFDQGKIIPNTDADQHVLAPSGEQLAVRAAYLRSGVQRDEKKSAEGTPGWETLGTELRGLEGLVGTSTRVTAPGTDNTHSPETVCVTPSPKASM